MSAPSLHEQIWAWPNVWAAWQNASRGKRRHASVAAFEHRLEENLVGLQEELRGSTWRPGPYTNFFIHEPKRRLISAAPFRDRVVHHALCNVTAPLLERSFTADSFANRVGMGTHRALDACQRHCRRFRYFLAMDVRRFFPTVDHAILSRVLERKIVDPAVMEVVRRILAGGACASADGEDTTWFPGDDLFAVLRPRGLPIGNLTSQIWANCYLDGLDHFVGRDLRCPGYVRYVDDLRLFADEKPVLWEWRDAIAARLTEPRLRAHPGAQPREVSEGVSFLGFRIWPDRRRLKRRKGVHAARKLRRLAAGFRSGERSLDEFRTALRAWLEHAGHGNTIGLRKAVLRQLVVTPGPWRNPVAEVRS